MKEVGNLELDMKVEDCKKAWGDDRTFEYHGSGGDGGLLLHYYRMGLGMKELHKTELELHRMTKVRDIQIRH